MAGQPLFDAVERYAAQAVAQHDGRHPVEAEPLVLRGFVYVCEGGQQGQ